MLTPLSLSQPPKMKNKKRKKKTRKRRTASSGNKRIRRLKKKINMNTTKMLTLSHLPVPKTPRFNSPITPRLRTQSPFNLPTRPATRNRDVWICRADLSQDAPFAIAIGACLLNSFLFHDSIQAEEEGEEDEAAAIGPTDARFAVMAIISFIPYFNWLSWIFAWMDTGKQRYAVYAAVYLAPYFRTNLSLSPEESWLPIASIVLCVIHVQLEASLRDGDNDRFAFFNEAVKRLGLVTRSKDGHHKRQRVHKERTSSSMNLPSGKAHSRDEIQRWRVPRKPSQEAEHDDMDDKMEH